jgi:hypothetical protein
VKPTARTASPSCAADSSSSSQSCGQSPQSVSQELHVSSPLHSQSPQYSSIGGGVSQSDGQRECSFFSHIPFPQIGSDGFPASAIFAIAQTKHAVNNNKTKKFLFDIIIFSFRYVDLSSCALLIRTAQFALKRKTLIINHRLLKTI